MNHFEIMHTCCGYIEDLHVNFYWPKNNFWQNYGILDLDNFEVSLQHRLASLCNQFLPGFSSNHFETLHRCYEHIKNVHMTLSKQENNFWQNYGIFDLDNFQVMLQYGLASLCKISSSQSFQAINLKLCIDVISTLKICVWLFAGEKIFVDKITALDLDNFEVRFQEGVARLCNQLLSEFSSIQFGTLHTYYKHIEDVHVTFCTQKCNF